MKKKERNFELSRKNRIRMGENPTVNFGEYFGSEIQDKINYFCFNENIYKTSFVIEYDNNVQVVEKLESLGFNFEKEVAVYDLKVEKKKINKFPGFLFSIMDKSIIISADQKSREIQTIKSMKLAKKRCNLNEVCLIDSNVEIIKNNEIKPISLEFVNLEKLREINFNFGETILCDDPLNNLATTIGSIGYKDVSKIILSKQMDFMFVFWENNDKNILLKEKLMDGIETKIQNKEILVEVPTISQKTILRHILSDEKTEERKRIESGLDLIYQISESTLNYPTVIEDVNIVFEVQKGHLTKNESLKFVFNPMACKKIINSNFDIIKCYCLNKK